MTKTFSQIIEEEALATKTKVSEVIKATLERDYKKIPKAIWNQNNTRLNWKEDEKLYSGNIGICECGQRDFTHTEEGNCPNGETKLKIAKEEEWIAAMQHTIVPIFAHYCDAEKRVGNILGKCNATNFVTILQDGETIQCRTCKRDTKVKIIPAPGSEADKILNLIKQEA